MDPRGPAAQAGLKEGDLIVAINGQPLSSVDDLHRFLAEWPIGEAVAAHHPPGPGAPGPEGAARGGQGLRILTAD